MLRTQLARHDRTVAAPLVSEETPRLVTRMDRCGAARCFRLASRPCGETRVATIVPFGQRTVNCGEHRCEPWVTLDRRSLDLSPCRLKASVVQLAETSHHGLGVAQALTSSRATHAEMDYVLAPTFHRAAPNRVPLSPRLPVGHLSHVLPVTGNARGAMFSVKQSILHRKQTRSRMFEMREWHLS